MNRRPMPTATGRLLLASATILLAGCGSGLVQVEGTVSLDGAPLDGAKVSFIPAGDGIPASGTTDAAGAFRLAVGSGQPGARPGRYQVAVTKVKVTVVDAAKARRIEAERRTEVEIEGDPDGLVQVIEHVVPRRYGDPATSGLEADVPAAAPIRFELRSR